MEKCTTPLHHEAFDTYLCAIEQAWRAYYIGSPDMVYRVEPNRGAHEIMKAPAFELLDCFERWMRGQATDEDLRSAIERARSLAEWYDLAHSIASQLGDDEIDDILDSDPSTPPPSWVRRFDELVDGPHWTELRTLVVSSIYERRNDNRESIGAAK